MRILIVGSGGREHALAWKLKQRQDVTEVFVAPGNGGTSFSNEVNFFFSGDSGAVKQAVIAARDVGLQLLKTLAPDEELKSTTTPYII